MTVKLSRQQLSSLPSVVAALAAENKKDKDLKMALTALTTELDVAAKQSLYALELQPELIASVLTPLLARPPTAHLFRLLSLLPLSQISQISQIATSPFPEHLITLFQHPLARAPEAIPLLFPLLSAPISAESHLKLLICAFRQSPEALFQAVALACLKFDATPEILETLVSYCDKALKNVFLFDKFGPNFEAQERQNFVEIVPQILLIIAQNYPHNALNETFTELFYQIYSKLIQLIPISTNKNQNVYLYIIEHILKIFLPLFPISLFFDHITAFCVRILNFAEVRNFTLKSNVIMHLTRLFSSDDLDLRILEILPARRNVLLLDAEAEFPEKFTSATAENEFFLFQRKHFPPGRLLQLVYANFDCKFDFPDLFASIFKAFQDQIDILKQYKNANFQVEGVKNTRFYSQKLSIEAKRILDNLGDGNQYYSKISKFIRTCGVVNIEEGIFLNMKQEKQDVEMAYKSTNIIESLKNAFSRLIDSIATNFNLCDFSLKFCDFQPTFGLSSMPKIENQERKIKMQAGFQLFDEAPMKAISLFERLGYLPELTKLDGVEIEEEAPKKRVKRTFEQEFQHNLDLIDEFSCQYTNAESYFQSVVAFVFKYLKNADFDIGLSRTGFGELIGGARVLNRAILLHFTTFFEQNYLPQNAQFVSALRAFLGLFRLPGEGQVIDRIVSFFSWAYAKSANLSHRTTHGLSYAAIMLNTDLHNASARQGRMTREMFVRNTKQIDCSGELSDEFLGAVYDEIERSPFTLGSIEAIKAKFAILSKLGDDADAQASREGEACLEWVKIGMRQFNSEILSITNFEFQNCVFDEISMNHMIQRLGVENLKSLLNLTRAVEPSWPSQMCLQNALRLYLRSAMGEIRQEVVEIYISYSEILENPILQRPAFDSQSTALGAYRNGAFSPEFRTPKMSPQKLDLIQFLIERASFRSGLNDSLVDFGPKIEFGAALLQIGEVVSRCVYVDLLLRKGISRRFRNAGGPEALRQDLTESLFGNAEVVQNYIIISKYFAENQTLAKVEKLFANASALSNEEFKYFVEVLSTNAETEQKIYLNIDYQQFSISKLISTLSVKLEENLGQFEDLYPLVTPAVVSILSTSNHRLGSNIAISVHQIIMQYLLKNRSSENSRLFGQILAPFTQTLNSSELYMISIILSYLSSYLTIYDKNSLPPFQFLVSFAETVHETSRQFFISCENLIKKLDKSMNMKSQIVQLQGKEFVREINQSLIQTVKMLVFYVENEEIFEKVNELFSVLVLIQQNENCYISLYLELIQRFSKIPNQERKICKILCMFLSESNVEKRTQNQVLIRQFLREQNVEFLVAFCAESIDTFSSQSSACVGVIDGAETCGCGVHCGVEFVEIDENLAEKTLQILLQKVQYKQILNIIVNIIKRNQIKVDFLIQELVKIEFHEKLIFVWESALRMSQVALPYCCAFLKENMEQFGKQEWKFGLHFIFSNFLDNQTPEHASCVCEVLKIELAKPVADRKFLLEFIVQLQMDVFEKVFKDQVYDSLLECVLDDDLEIRKQVYWILKDWYKR
ncbi:Sec7 family protein [Spironucleus salmonicida]|uniref:Sec7 family protein n=1 Tax=Spironucleus salmonicida TaxID=348837 RepID=V6M5Y1_9EUKA|nr:Sec7 family protein [Spironucleus salmonicida]|eukprot:EST48759.1 Sec7-domain-containing protein [Spironucleus salmonicida]